MDVRKDKMGEIRRSEFMRGRKKIAQEVSVSVQMNVGGKIPDEKFKELCIELLLDIRDLQFALLHEYPGEE